MKNILVILVALSFSFKVVSQTTKIKSWYGDDSALGLKKVVEVLEADTNIAHGEYLYFYQQGSVKIKGRFKLNKPTGKWEYFYESGVLKKTIDYISDSVSVWSYFYESGETKKNGKVLNHKKDSTWNYFYENGSLLKTGDYLQGKKNSEWKYFFEDGVDKAIARYEVGSGTYTENYYDGSVKMQGPVMNNLSEGVWTYYHQNGAKQSQGYESNGLKNGKWNYYYENDSLSSSGNYVGGKKEGDWKFYHKNGALSSEGIMNDGFRDGYWKLFTETGDFKGEAVLNNGTGSYTEFYNNGKVKVKGQYLNDKNEGEWKYYYENGTLEGEAEFNDGSGEYTGYYQSGEIKKKGRIENGEQVGTWVLYNKDESIAGYYKLIPDNIDNSNDQIEVGMTDNDPPIYHVDNDVSRDFPTYKRRKTKYNPFKPRRGESTGWIVFINPVAIVRGELPVGAEHFIQERLGHELRYTFRRSYLNEHQVSDSSLFTNGFSIDFRQKFYGKHSEMRGGMFYLAHELRYLRNNVFAKYENKLHSLKENSFEYGWTCGHRSLRDIHDGGLTLDFYIGAAIAYKTQERKLNTEIAPLFDEVFANKKVVPRFRLGFSIGYLF